MQGGENIMTKRASRSEATVLDELKNVPSTHRDNKAWARNRSPRWIPVAASLAICLALACAFAFPGLWPASAQAASPAASGAVFPGQSVENANISAADTSAGITAGEGLVADVKVSVKVKGSGWKGATSGKTAGTTSKKGLRKLKASIASSSGASDSISYRAYAPKMGWTKPASNGKACSTGKRDITAVSFKLKGAAAKEYDVYYRAYLKDFGWLGWAKNGKMAGTKSNFGHIGALQVRLVAKGGKFDGDVRKPSVKNRWQALERKYLEDDDVKQILEVKYTGGTKAKVVLRAKSGSGWKTAVSCKGYVGKRGVGKTREGLARTPAGDFEITAAFGIKGDPGAKLDYVKVTRSMYWCGDRKYYNQLIDIEECPHDCKGEHLIDCKPYYNYGLFFDYNTDPVRYGKGSAFFVHCKGGEPYTEGCIAVSRSNMVKIIRKVSDGARICIYEK